jgi:hypothetical protein
MLEVIATRLIRSVRSLGSVTARIASEFVRTQRPSRSESRGSEPACLQRMSSLLVPSAPAAITTPRARTVRRSRRSHAPGRCVVTS